jgi:hypothetical protein
MCATYGSKRRVVSQTMRLHFPAAANVLSHVSVASCVEFIFITVEIVYVFVFRG